jgi:hypothetical protein
MPKLATSLHLDMYQAGRRRRSLAGRIRSAFRAFLAKNNVYGIEWGDPDEIPPLMYMRDHFLIPYVTSDSTVVEIGVGGGRWTRYMLHAKRIYAVDYHQEILNELKSNYPRGNITFVKNNGDDFPGVAPHSVDFVFSFGTFVHLDLDIIDRYLGNMKPLLKPEANVVIQYADKTKPLGASTDGFSDNDPQRMRNLVLSHGYAIFEEDVKTMWHSSVIRFGLVR